MVQKFKETDWKKLSKKIIFLPIWLIIIFTILSTAGLITVFINGWDTTILAYVVYVLSFYTLSVLVVFFVKVFPGYYRSVKSKVYSNSLGNRYMTDIEFKVRVSLYISLSISIIYSIFKLLSGIYYSSLWLGAVAVYYIILSVTRFLILRYMRSDRKHRIYEWRRYRLCGILMLFLNMALLVIIVQMVWKNVAIAYPDVVVITIAAYTFYIVTMSIKDIVKYRKYESPVMTAAKIIRFTAAMLSLLTMETTMLASFGEDESFNRIMTSLTGIGVGILILTMSVYMIVNANKNIKKLENREERTENG